MTRHFACVSPETQFRSSERLFGGLSDVPMVVDETGPTGKVVVGVRKGTYIYLLSIEMNSTLIDFWTCFGKLTPGTPMYPGGVKLKTLTTPRKLRSVSLEQILSDTRHLRRLTAMPGSTSSE